MERNCLHCHQIVTGNFCPNCGQKEYSRIDRKYVLNEVQSTILHVNKGFLYSVKNIIENPGKTARAFIDGNRIEHYRPLLLAFVLSGISTFISFKILGLYDILVNHYSSSTPNFNTQFMTEYLSFLSSYNSILTLLALPVLAFMTRLVLRKWGHNYYEHIVMNAYVLSFYTIVSIIILYPIMYFLKQDFNAIMLVSSFSTLLIPFILIWFYKEFYPGKTLKSIIGKTLSIVGLIILSYIGVIIFGAVVGFVFAVLKGPEALDYVKPI